MRGKARWAGFKALAAVFSLATDEAGAAKAVKELEPMLKGKTIGVQTASTAAAKPGNEDMTVTGPRFQGGLLRRGSSVGLRKDDTQLKAMFNDAIAAAKADGTIAKLSQKWFGFDVTPK